MHLNTDEFNTSNDIINTFAYYFSSVYKNNNYFNVNNKQQNPPKDISSSLHSYSIDLLEVFKSLGSLSSNSSPGPDLITNIFLKNVNLSFTLLYITYLIYHSLSAFFLIIEILVLFDQFLSLHLIYPTLRITVQYPCFLLYLKYLNP